MPNLNDTRSAIETFVDINISGTVPIAYDNVPFDADGIDMYAHLSLSFAGSENVNIGGVLQKRIRHTGDMVFKLYTKIGSGTATAFSNLDFIKTQIENKYLDPKLLTYAAEPIRKGIGKEGYYSYFLRVPFVSDEC